MKKEGSLNICSDVPGARVTRARAAAYRAAGVAPPMMPLVVKPDKEKQKINSKRAASDENSHVDPQTNAVTCKKRAVLKDVSNTCRGNLARPCGGSVKMQNRPNILKVKQCSSLKRSKLPPTASTGSTQACVLVKNEIAKEVQKIKVLEPKEVDVPTERHDHLLSVQCLDVVKGGESIRKAPLLDEHCFVEGLKGITDSKNGSCSDLAYIDIDVDFANPQMCCAYASDIYVNLHATELVRRPVGDFMETLQRDITQIMRGILIDWLVEVAEEYKLVPDTLYLTVYIIDRFLSQNYIERQRLQLLGITCMLIASKYEEICAPRVEEFCFITDNTYDKTEVLKMESEVLNCLGFQLSVPTIKTFLRRFLRAGQASNKVPTLALGYLANYLAELTLVEYSFVKFLPSIVAASAIFLARWTLDQSNHPWNRTLEHYTSFKAMDLKVTVFALQELQVNSKGCPLNAIREKYKQQKFESVAALASPEFPQSLFC